MQTGHALLCPGNFSRALPNTLNIVSVSGFTLYVSLLTDLFRCLCNDHKRWLFAIDFSRAAIPQIKDDYS